MKPETIGLMVHAQAGLGVLHRLTGVIAEHQGDITSVEILENSEHDARIYFEIALPAPSFGAAKDHWEQFGFVGMDEPDAMLPHVSCTSDTIDIGLYQPAHLQMPTLLFEVDDFNDSLARLDAVGITPNGRVPGPLRQMPAAMLTAPEGTAILLSPAPDG